MQKYQLDITSISMENVMITKFQNETSKNFQKVVPTYLKVCTIFAAKTSVEKFFWFSTEKLEQIFIVK